MKEKGGKLWKILFYPHFIHFLKRRQLKQFIFFIYILKSHSANNKLILFIRNANKSLIKNFAFIKKKYYSL